MDWNYALGYASHGQDGGLRGIMDCLEGIDTTHAQIADREHAIGRIRCAEFSELSTVYHTLTTHRNPTQHELIYTMMTGTT